MAGLDPRAPDPDGLTAAAKRQLEMEDQYARGQKLFEAGEWSQAKDWFESLWKTQPDYRDVSRRLDEIQKQLSLDGLFREAVRASQVQDWQGAWRLFAQIVQQEQRPPEDYQRLEVLERRRYLFGLYTRAHGAAITEQWQEARDVLEEIEKIDANAEENIRALQTRIRRGFEPAVAQPRLDTDLAHNLRPEKTPAASSEPSSAVSAAGGSKPAERRAAEGLNRPAASRTDSKVKAQSSPLAAIPLRGARPFLLGAGILLLLGLSVWGGGWIINTLATRGVRGFGAPADMALVSAGSFSMGYELGESDEKPVHEVNLEAYYIDIYEVTNAQYAQFLNSEGNQEEEGTTWIGFDQPDVRIHQSAEEWQADAGYEDHPVTQVTWYGARAYCAWRSARLPTEAEWEFAARGKLAGKLYPWGDAAPICQGWISSGATFENIAICDSAGTEPVGRYAPNGYGLYDSTGNVWEWVNDWYSPNYYGQSPPSNPTGPDQGGYRVLRGGSYDSFPSALRLANRNSRDPSSTDSSMGFRCARSP